MNKLIFLSSLMIFVSACSTTIPLQSNLSDQTMLMADNKNIKANYTLTSEVSDGLIDEVYVQKNGTRSTTKNLEYASETAFNNIWSSYFSNKFNDFSRDTMYINVNLMDLYLKETSSTSIGATLFTGNSKSNVEAITKVFVEVEYKGETFKNEFEVSSSGYQETQSTEFGTYSKNNPMEQKAQLLEGSLNRAIIQFENFVSQIINADRD